MGQGGTVIRYDFPDYDLRFYVRDEWGEKPWAWKQGFLHYIRRPWANSNPHPDNTEKARQFDEGWNEADFYSKIENGYFDW